MYGRDHGRDRRGSGRKDQINRQYTKYSATNMVMEGKFFLMIRQKGKLKLNSRSVLTIRKKVDSTKKSQNMHQHHHINLIAYM
jgi:hypothetical protein